jgi:hypothetical protein
MYASQLHHESRFERALVLPAAKQRKQLNSLPHLD